MVGDVAYKLDLPFNSRIHNVLHVSILKKKVGTHPISNTLPPVTKIGGICSVIIKDTR